MPFTLGPQARAGGFRLAEYETIGSTNAEARARARAGDPGRLWVAALAQTAGHGRRGLPWQTPPGNLAASLLFRPAAPVRALATLGFAAGLALEEALRMVVRSSPVEVVHASPSPPCGERVAPKGLGEGSSAVERGADDPSPSPSPQGGGEGVGASLAARLKLKWPNDVLLDGAKLAGILLETTNDEQGGTAVVIGFGVNVRCAPAGLPYPVASLAALGRITAESLFTALTEAWVEAEALWADGQGFAAVRRSWLQRAAGLGAPIAVQAGQDVMRGTFETIDGDGRLVLRRADGSLRHIAAGEVHFGTAATVGA